MSENDLYGPHMGEDPMCSICKNGHASRDLHCTWCGESFATRRSYGDHMDVTGGCFDHMSTAIKLVVNMTGEATSVGERNWRSFWETLMNDKLARLRVNARQADPLWTIDADREANRDDLYGQGTGTADYGVGIFQQRNWNGGRY